jgi:hypothetical protein
MVPDIDVWPFRQILSSKETMHSAPGSKALLGTENARLVPLSASLFMDIDKAFRRIRA